jgi:ribonuclease BN (tRNA processing enzyme)
MSKSERPFERTRRSFLATSLGAAALPLFSSFVPLRSAAQPPTGPPAPRPPPRPGTRLVLLGTRGGPGIDLTRAEPSSAVVVDGVPYLVDCGYGALRALVASGIGYQQLGAVFFTHLHDDHTSDLPALLSHQWTGGKTTPTDIYGPSGTERLVQAALDFLRPNVEIRTVDEGRTSDPAAMFNGHDVAATPAPTRALADDRVIVTAVENTHYPERATAKMSHRALGYRFETKDRSIVFSGDTAYSENLVTLARGADYFVCEAMAQSVHDSMVTRAKQAAAEGNTENIWRHVAETHSTPADIARMATKAQVKTVVLNHLLMGQRAAGALDFAISSFVDGVRAGFDGQVIVGQDLMVL